MFFDNIYAIGVDLAEASMSNEPMVLHSLPRHQAVLAELVTDTVNISLWYGRRELVLSRVNKRRFPTLIIEPLQDGCSYFDVCHDRDELRHLGQNEVPISLRWRRIFELGRMPRNLG